MCPQTNLIQIASGENKQGIKPSSSLTGPAPASQLGLKQVCEGTGLKTEGEETHQTHMLEGTGMCDSTFLNFWSLPGGKREETT